MYIRSVISNLDTWEKLEAEHAMLLQDIEESLAQLPSVLEYESDGTRNGDEQVLSISSIFKSFSQELTDRGWQRSIRLKIGNPVTRILGEVDFEKEGVGLDLFLGRKAKLESYLFAKIPFFIKAGKFHTIIFILPTTDLEQQLPKGISKFEYFKELLLEFTSLPLKYPFVILGISDHGGPIEFTPLNSELDVFLIQKLGRSLNELLIEGEAQEYDFKVMLPENQKIAQEICGFANQEHGGLLIIGISDDSHIKGIEKEYWDTIQLKITAIISSAISPTPEFRIHRFDMPDDTSKLIIIVEVFESFHKPCMTNHRVYVRKSASVRPADTEDIRRMLIR